eukprot:scaffold6420_cov168-Amphora_coffeaeformis.AAC.3
MLRSYVLAVGDEETLPLVGEDNLSHCGDSRDVSTVPDFSHVCNADASTTSTSAMPQIRFVHGLRVTMFEIVL